MEQEGEEQVVDEEYEKYKSLWTIHNHLSNPLQVSRLNFISSLNLEPTDLQRERVGVQTRQSVEIKRQKEV